MTPARFKQVWQYKVTWKIIAKCAKDWRLFENPTKTSMNLVRYEVLKYAGIVDAEDYHPDNYQKDDDDDDWDDW